MGSYVPIPKVGVKVNGKEIQLEDLIDALEGRKRIIEGSFDDNLQAISDEVRDMRDNPGPLPHDARQNYDAMLRDHGRQPLDGDDMRQEYYRGDSSREDALHNPVIIGSGIELPDVTVDRRWRILENGGDVSVLDSPHTVDYTMVHLSGFNMFGGMVSRPWTVHLINTIRARDILYTAISRAMGTIRGIIVQRFIDSMD